MKEDMEKRTRVKMSQNKIYAVVDSSKGRKKWKI
jgi:hypothetical protein